MRKIRLIALLSITLFTSWDSVGQARLIGVGGAAMIDLTGTLELGWPVVPLARLSVGLLIFGADIDTWFLPTSVQLVPALALRLPALLIMGLYLSVAPVSFQIAPAFQTVLRSAIRLGIGIGFGFVYIFSEMVLLAQWNMPWRGPGLGMGVQIGF